MKTDPPSFTKHLPVGTRCIVAECSGCASGARVTVIAPFFWREAEDGTYAPPGPDQLPIRYADGRRGFMFINRLRPVACGVIDGLSAEADSSRTDEQKGETPC